MFFTKEILQLATISNLRDIGKQIGVKAPSTLKKTHLIQSIIGVQENRLEPHFSTRGKKLSSKISDISFLDFFSLNREKIDEIIEKALDDFLASLKEIILKIYNEKQKGRC